MLVEPEETHPHECAHVWPDELNAGATCTLCGTPYPEFTKLDPSRQPDVPTEPSFDDLIDVICGALRGFHEGRAPREIRDELLASLERLDLLCDGGGADDD